MGDDLQSERETTSRTITGVPHHLAEPSGLLKYSSHFGHFLSWLGCDLSSRTPAKSADEDNCVSAAAAGASPALHPMASMAWSSKDEPGSAAGSSLTATASMAWSSKAGRDGSVKDESGSAADSSLSYGGVGEEESALRQSLPKAKRKRVCAVCDSATAKPGVFHRCWFNSWDSAVQLKNMEQKAVARLQRLRGAAAAVAHTPVAASTAEVCRSRASEAGHESPGNDNGQVSPAEAPAPPKADE